MSGLELGRRSKGLKRHFALRWCCDTCSCPEQTLRYQLDGCRVQEHDHNDSLLLSAGSFALLFGFYFFGSLYSCSFCFSLILLYFLGNSRFVILSSSFLFFFVVFLLLLFLIHPSFISNFWFTFMFLFSVLFDSSLFVLFASCTSLLFLFPLLLLLLRFSFSFLSIAFYLICWN